MKLLFMKLLIKLDNIGIIRLSDKTKIKLEYKKEIKKKLDLNNPQLFNEKIQWLKLYDHNELYTTMVDKNDAKEYVGNIIGKEYIIPTLGLYDRFDDIDFEKLPDKFVIKCTHDSGSVIVCKDKNNFNIEDARKKINKMMKRNYYLQHREWPYKNVKHRIIIEKFIVEENELLKDYKFFCFNGEPYIMYISEGLENHETARMSFFDMNFNLTDCKRADYKLLDYMPKKPVNFDKMKEFSKILSKNIPHVRVDFYEIGNKLYFGELTFYTCCGCIPFEDEKWNIELGKKLELPKK